MTTAAKAQSVGLAYKTTGAALNAATAEHRAALVAVARQAEAGPLTTGALDAAVSEVAALRSRVEALAELADALRRGQSAAQAEARGQRIRDGQKLVGRA